MKQWSPSPHSYGLKICAANPTIDKLWCHFVNRAWDGRVVDVRRCAVQGSPVWKQALRALAKLAVREQDPPLGAARRKQLKELPGTICLVEIGTDDGHSGRVGAFSL